MAMSPEERALVEETVEALGALSFVLNAAFRVLNQDVFNFKPRIRELLDTRSATNVISFHPNADTHRMLKRAFDLIDSF